MSDRRARGTASETTDGMTKSCGNRETRKLKVIYHVKKTKESHLCNFGRINSNYELKTG